MTCLPSGCGRLPRFPIQEVRQHDQRLGFDLNNDGQDDYWQVVDAAGRKAALQFDDDADGQPDSTVPLDEPPSADVLQVVIILDGVPFEVIDELYSQGRFRLFPPPSRMISVFPVLTDLALARAFQAGPCLGYEALYYDHAANSLSDGNRVYLDGTNAPWTPLMNYRCSTNWDTLCYLNPSAVWRHELDGIIHTIAEAKTGTVYVYSVGTAGLGTCGGRQAIREYLETVDTLCEQVTYERRGQVRFTLLADHGHGLTPCRRVSFRSALEAAGFRVGKSLRDEADVVLPYYGLVTCAVLHTRSPAKVAEVIARHEATDLAMYRAAPGIMVRNASGEARIHRVRDRFIYEPVTGDPLRLEPIIERMAAEGKLAADGSVSDRDWFEATADHDYPDPLQRIWCAFEPGCLVDNPADVLVSLREGYACGSKFFSALVGVESTHGALSQGSSTTFIMSNAAPLPAVMRVDDVGNVLKTPNPQR